MEEQYGKHPRTSHRRRSMLPLSNDQGDGYLPAFSRPRSAISFSSTSSRPLSPTSPRLPPTSRGHWGKNYVEDGLAEPPPGSPRRRASTPQPWPATPRRDLGNGARKVSKAESNGGADTTLQRASQIEKATAPGRNRSKSVGRKTSSSDDKGIVRGQDVRSQRPGTPLVKAEAVRRASRPSRPSRGLPRRETTIPVTSVGNTDNVTSRVKSRRESAPASPPGQTSFQAATTHRPGGTAPSSRRSSVCTSLSRSSSTLHVGADIPPPPPGFDNESTSGALFPPSTSPKKRATMGGLMNVLQFRRKTMRSRHHRSGSAAPLGEHLDEKEELELLEGDPLSANAETNRFTLSLSPEAQFAMLKGYEDRLQRALAPSDYGALHADNADDDEPEEDGERALKPEVGCLDAFQDLSQASDAAQYRTKMNWKLENAMDIIDCMHSNRGIHVTSERFRSKVSDPVRHFRRWNRACDHDLAMARVKLQVVAEGSP